MALLNAMGYFRSYIVFDSLYWRYLKNICHDLIQIYFISYQKKYPKILCKVI